MEIKKTIDDGAKSIGGSAVKIGNNAVPVVYGLGLLDIVAGKLGFSTGVLQGAIDTLNNFGIVNGTAQFVILAAGLFIWVKSQKQG